MKVICNLPINILQEKKTELPIAAVPKLDRRNSQGPADVVSPSGVVQATGTEDPKDGENEKEEIINKPAVNAYYEIDRKLLLKWFMTLKGLDPPHFGNVPVVLKVPSNEEDDKKRRIPYKVSDYYFYIFFLLF